MKRPRLIDDVRDFVVHRPAVPTYVPAASVNGCGQVVEHWAMDPQRVVLAQASLTKGFLDLWTNSLKRMQGEPVPAVAEPDS